MYSYTINLVEMADTAEGGELQCGGVDLTYNPCGDNRTFKKTLEMGCDTIPCYFPKYGDVSDVHLPWAYASIVDPRYFPKAAIFEQVDVMQLGKGVNFCVAPFDGAPLCRIGDDRSVICYERPSKPAISRPMQSPSTQDRQLPRKCFQVRRRWMGRH